MICYCEGPDNGHEFKLVSEKDGVKRFECPVCKRPVEESLGDPGV